MRKYFFILCSLSFFINTSYAVDSTITITGYLKDNACSVAVESQNFIVNLMTHASKQLYRVGDVTYPVSFKIVFDQCGGSAKALRVGYTGVADIDNTDLLKIDTGSNAASGVGIQLLDQDKKPIALNANQDSLTWFKLIASQSNVLDFYARLMATRSPVIAGTVTSTANFTLEFQ